MLQDRFPGEYEIVGRNDPALLARLSPTGSYRAGAFEVTRVGDDGAADDQLLYSKLDTKRHLVGTRIKNAEGEVVHDDRPFDAWVAERLRPDA